MPPPNGMSEDKFLQGIQSSASAIFDERKRLNDAFAALQTALAAVRPNYMLYDDGTVVKATIEPTPPPPAPAPEPPPAAPEPPPEPPPEPAPEPPPAAPEPNRSLVERRLPTLLQVLGNADKPMSFSALERATQWSPSTMSRALKLGMTQGSVIRTDKGLYAKRQKRPTEDERSGGMSASLSSKPSPSSSASASQQAPIETPTEQSRRGEEGEEAPPPRPSPQAKPASSGEGPARSPKPRSEMRPQQIEREERLDSLILWMQDQQINSFNPSDVADKLDFIRDGAQARDDMEELIKRGIMRRSGSLVVPETVKRMREEKAAAGVAGGKVGGRPAVEFLLVDWPGEVPKGEVVEEGVDDIELRDALVLLKEATLEEVASTLGIETHPENLQALKGRIIPFIQRGIVALNGDQLVYMAPSGPGAAATRDIQRGKEQAAAEERRIASLPVAGTGAPRRSASEQVNEILRIARKSDKVESVKPQGNEHFAIKFKDVPVPVRIPSTPGAQLTAQRQRLRKLGLIGV